MDRTVSRRSEPSSRTAFNGRTAQPLEHTTAPGGEEPTSRCQTFRRCELLGKISLLSLDQAPFCLCTRGPISVRPEETFARLRYLLGGLRPIETVYLRLSLGPYVLTQGKAQSQSQGTVKLHRVFLSRVQVVRIFTDMSISPSLSPRQCPDRYAFRAGRNLPDKEFRYLRTVIVTAAVHRGFGRRLPCHQSPGPGHCDPLCEEAPLLPKYPFVEGRSSFSWEYGMGYFSAVAPGTRSEPRAPPTAWELTVSCSISLPDGGSFHPSLTGAAFYLLRLAARRLYCSPTTRFHGFRLLPFRSPLLRESLLLSFPLATKMFQFARLSLACPWIQQQFERLTYSGISGSMLIFQLPEAFRRLLRPSSSLGA
ncbi:hypothetical protein L1887_58921 [Cichorium endivia]|nr:hypothetical protein L1887_58921 [Cichorium endivia]